jgi:hypothetical protein
MALEHFFYSDPINATELKSFILRAVISDLDCDAMANTVMALLKAYWTILENDEEVGEVPALDGKAAEDFYRKVYVKAFNARIPGYLDEKDPDVTWPESLPFYEYGKGYVEAELFPKWLVNTCALAAVEQDVASIKAVARFHRAMETPGTPEHQEMTKTLGTEQMAKIVAEAKAREVRDAK